MRLVLAIAILVLVCGCASAPEKKMFTSSDFDNLRFLEGRWIGKAPDGSAFYEEYRFVAAGKLRSDRHADATFSSSNESSTVVLHDGRVTSTWNDFTWIASALVPGKACFVPVNAPSSFCWERASENEVHVIQRWKDEHGAQQEYVVVLLRA
ncbi:MAG: hypothetical protein ABIR16_04940 [Dokdonella sp.]